MDGIMIIYAISLVITGVTIGVIYKLMYFNAPYAFIFIAPFVPIVVFTLNLSIIFEKEFKGKKARKNKFKFLKNIMYLILDLPTSVGFYCLTVGYVYNKKRRNSGVTIQYSSQVKRSIKNNYIKNKEGLKYA